MCLGLLRCLSQASDSISPLDLALMPFWLLSLDFQGYVLLEDRGLQA